MKLAEALLERADLQKRLSQMNNRLRSNARVQEGEKPAENPKELLKELAAMTDRLEYLVAAINLTNSAAKIGGEPLTCLLARRDAWQQRMQIGETGQPHDLFMETRIIFHSAGTKRIKMSIQTEI